MSVPRAAGVLAAILSAACARGPVESVVDLRPFTWTAAQIPVGASMIRYAFPDEPAAPAGARDGAAAALAPAESGVSETRLAGYAYDCAREDREPEEACTVFLDFWLLELEPPLAGVALAVYRARLEGAPGDAPPPGSTWGLVLDSHGREWYHRALSLESGGAFAHYSRPIDARRAFAVTSLTTRAPDRVAARDLARDAIGRTAIAALQE
ncbi:MAG TPA: hypothetical protein VII72_21035 [Myxococcota bacterium]|jgi:hypothetical protein